VNWGGSKSAWVVKPNPWSIFMLGPPVTITYTHVSSAPTEPFFAPRDLLEFKWYLMDAPAIFVARAKCLAAMAYLDYFPERPERGRCLRALVTAALTQASPGWFGTYGPNQSSLFEAHERQEGNYDMTQMGLIPIAYQFYGELSETAREHLITSLLACGRIRRPDFGDALTSGPVQPHWRDAGPLEQGETENHILMMLTTRYLTNQLLYQRDHSRTLDNRRNETEDGPSCMELLLGLLRNVLVDDFSEYNAKSYQEETRWALLNLCSFAYDHEVRLAARMVLDYVAARVAVSSNDLRRMVPFRRVYNGVNAKHFADGAMDVGLLDWANGADRMIRYFAVAAGNLRAFEHTRFAWGMADNGQDLTLEAVSDYRLPPLIHELFVNDAHRRFYQRLRRVDQPEGTVGRVTHGSGELTAGSPSYLITAGGEAAIWAIDPVRAGIVWGDQDQQLGVGVTTSFMPTGSTAPPPGPFELAFQHLPPSEKPELLAAEAREMIQFGTFTSRGSTSNYGVAPDFACGHQTYLPAWVLAARESPQYSYSDRSGDVRERPTLPGFFFVDKGSPFVVVGVTKDGKPMVQRAGVPGYYLAIYQETVGGFGLLEACDTWLHPEVTFAEFKAGVLARNVALHVADNVPTAYETHSGTSLEFVIWRDPRLNFNFDEHPGGARVAIHRYGADGPDGREDAGNVTDRLVNGTVLNGSGDGRVEIANVHTGDRLILDMTDQAHPQRTLNGVVEAAGANQEVWLDFGWTGPTEGDVYRPFNRLDRASAAVVGGGEIRMIPGTTRDRAPIRPRWPMRLVAPIGGVTIGGDAAPAPAGEGGRPRGEVWVDFAWSGPDQLAPQGDVLRPYDTIAAATAAVPAGGVVTIVPGVTAERGRIGAAKPMTLSAPLGHVLIGRPVPAAVPAPGKINLL
jgi:hypothetical protein